MENNTIISGKYLTPTNSLAYAQEIFSGRFHPGFDRGLSEYAIKAGVASGRLTGLLLSRIILCNIATIFGGIFILINKPILGVIIILLALRSEIRIYKYFNVRFAYAAVFSHRLADWGIRSGCLFLCPTQDGQEKIQEERFRDRMGLAEKDAALRQSRFILYFSMTMPLIVYISKIIVGYMLLKFIWTESSMFQAVVGVPVGLWFVILSTFKFIIFILGFAGTVLNRNTTQY